MQLNRRRLWMTDSENASHSHGASIMRVALTTSHLAFDDVTMALTYGYSPISSESRVRILALLGDGTDRTIEELTDALGLHPNTVREHINRLAHQGHILQHIDRRKTRGRPRLLVRLATGQPGASSPVIRRKALEAARRGDLMRRVMPDTVPEGLTQTEMHQLDAITEHLEECGMNAQAHDSALAIEVSDCPHASQDGQTSERCAVHVMMMQAVLAEAGGTLTLGQHSVGSGGNTCLIQLLRTRSVSV